MGKGCGAYGGRDTGTGVLLINEKEIDHLEDLDVDGNMT